MRNLALTNSPKPAYTCHAFAKSKASREKLNIPEANSTPTRAFFVRNFRTPKERQFKACSSMVERNRHALSVASVPLVLVSHPVTFYRPTVRSLAVVFEKLPKGLLAMIYQFKAVSRFDLRNTQKPISLFPRYTLKINAETLSQAVAKVSPFFVVLNVYNTGKNGINTFHKLAK
ncbi:ash family protein [Gallibacterium genomosp. 2]|uniref:ash family protein n=1 Tax=Gallibacterium genomosp. 2 TaxID=155517 RepID=UPI00068D355C|nr:ash family protein [Gallibacterium genomosp. 2]